MKYSTDWTSFSYIARKNWKWFIIKDWIKSENYEIIKDIIYSPKWNILAYIARKNWKWFSIKNWKKSKSYENITYHTFSPDWNEYTYIAKKKWERIYVKNWKESMKYDIVSEIKYSPNSKSFTFIAKRKWKYIVNKDWEIVNEYDYVNNFEYSPSWESFFYTTNLNNKWFIVSGICWKNTIKLTATKEEQNNYIVQKIKKEIGKTKTWKKYIKLIDNFINKASIKKIEKLANKVSKIDLNNKELSKYKDLLIYLKLQTENELFKRK